MNQTQVQHANALISTLHPQPTAQSLIEMTCMAPRQQPAKRYFTEVEPAVEFALTMNAVGYSAFVNVNPRSRMAGFETDVPYVTALALDLQPERTSIENVEMMLNTFGIPPSIVGISGFGAHMYLLVEPCERDAAKLVWERLCKWTGSDPIHSVNRIMRLPGSLNWKKNPPAWCFLSQPVRPERRYTIEAVVAAMDAAGAPAARAPKEGIQVPINPPEDWFTLCQKITEQPGGPGVIDIIETGERNAYSEKQLTRSEADWLVVCTLVRVGCSDEWIEWIYERKPVGNMKYRQAGVRYLRRTIETARRATAERISHAPSYNKYGHRRNTGASHQSNHARMHSGWRR